MSDSAQPTQITQVGTVIIPVADQDAAVAYYVDTLGFEKRLDAPYGEGERWIEVAPADAATTIALVPMRAGAPGAIEVSFSTADAHADHAALLSRGVDVDPGVIEMGALVPPMFTFRDMDGHQFRMVQRD